MHNAPATPAVTPSERRAPRLIFGVDDPAPALRRSSTPPTPAGDAPGAAGHPFNLTVRIGGTVVDSAAVSLSRTPRAGLPVAGREVVALMERHGARLPGGLSGPLLPVAIELRRGYARWVVGDLDVELREVA